MTEKLTAAPRPPQSAEEFAAYYELRWRVLREPWSLPRGSERDELEGSAYHLAIFSSGTPMAVGRLHQMDSRKGQIRCMAVDEAYQRRGLGSDILRGLENEARLQDLDQIFLNGRGNAVLFYEKHGYEVVSTGPKFWGIKHFGMLKQL